MEKFKDCIYIKDSFFLRGQLPCSCMNTHLCNYKVHKESELIIARIRVKILLKRIREHVCLRLYLWYEGLRNENLRAKEWMSLIILLVITVPFLNCKVQAQLCTRCSIASYYLSFEQLYHKCMSLLSHFKWLHDINVRFFFFFWRCNAIIFEERKIHMRKLLFPCFISNEVEKVHGNFASKWKGTSASICTHSYPLFNNVEKLKKRETCSCRRLLEKSETGEQTNWNHSLQQRWCGMHAWISQMKRDHRRY